MGPEDSDAGAVLWATSRVLDRVLAVGVRGGGVVCEAELAEQMDAAIRVLGFGSQ